MLDTPGRLTRRMTNEQIEKIFSYHSPKAEQVERYNGIREYARFFGLMINKLCPESREKSLAITKLQECVQMANASIAITEAE